MRLQLARERCSFANSPVNRYTKWCTAQPETRFDFVVLSSDSFDGSVNNKGSSTIKNKAALCVKHGL